MYLPRGELVAGRGFAALLARERGEGDQALFGDPTLLLARPSRACSAPATVGPSQRALHKQLSEQ